MNGLASPAQLRLSFARWALVTVPAIVFLGFLSGRLANSGNDNPWYAMLVKPEAQPPGWAFGVAWTILYVLIGLAIAMILNARGARGRPLAIGLFVVQLALNLAWSPLFFGARQVLPAFFLLVAILVMAIATTFAFARVRKQAAWLMVPYLAWLSFAAILNWQTHVLNPDAARLAPAAASTDIAF